jgi:putative colanic acid biosynthesis acetyltransferase WcaF
VRLAEFSNPEFDPGRGFLVRALWLGVSLAVFETGFPWPSVVKRGLLRLFGGRIGRGVVIKPRVTIKSPWRLTIGDHSWIGERVWLDSLAPIFLGANVCLSQGAMVETGNHDWSDRRFGLRLGPVTIEDGAWVAVRGLVLPGARLASHSVLTAGSVLAGDSEPWGLYTGVPAVRVKERRLRG